MLALFDIVIDFCVDMMHITHNTWREHIFCVMNGTRKVKKGQVPVCPRKQALHKIRLQGALRVCTFTFTMYKTD